jgi:hypothetical protein
MVIAEGLPNLDRPSAFGGCVAIAVALEETIGFQSLRMRSFRNG